MSSRRPGLAARLYRLLLIAYPRAFRDDHAGDAAELFADVHRETVGTRNRLRLWVRTVGTVVRDALAERRRQRDRYAPTHQHRGLMARVGRDARGGIRLWARDPVHAGVAATSVALGVGVSVAVLSLTLTIFLRPPVASEPDRLTLLGMVNDGELETSFAPSRAISLMQSLSTYQAVAAERFGWAWLTDGSQAVELEGNLVSFNYFDVLGLAPAAGRLFHEADAGVIAPHTVVVISDSLWASRYGRDPSIIGDVVDINGQPVEIVGVGPAGFRGVYAGQSRDVWMPHDVRDTTGTGQATALLRAGGHFELLGRLAPNETLQSSLTELTQVLRALEWRAPNSERPPDGFVERVRGIHPASRASYVDTPVRWLLVAGALLLVACLNGAGLQLARNLSRRRELSLRLALGGSRGDLVRQLAAETLVLAGGTAVLSVAVAAWAQRIVPGWFTYSLPGLSLEFDWLIVAAALAIALGSTLAFSLVPAWLVSRDDGSSGFQMGSHRVITGGASMGHVTVVVAQVGLSLMLVAGAEMMTRSMRAVIDSTGPNSSGVLHFRLRPSRAGYDDETAARFQRDVLDRLHRLPGVRAAAFAAVGPDRGWCCAVEVSAPDQPNSVGVLVENNAVTPSYFDVLGLTLDGGRLFTAGDRSGAPDVAIINRALAARFWPDQAAVGRRILVDDTLFEVIGVAQDVHPSQPGEGPVPYAYFPYWQRGHVDARLFVRHAEPTSRAFREVRDAIAAAGPDVHVGQVGTLAERVALTYAPQRALMNLLQAAALSALLLTALGMYGQLSVMVRRRTRETAIRLALGATPRRVLSDLVFYAMRHVTLGAAIGLVAVWGEGHILRAYLFGVQAGDPGPIGAAVAVLAGVGLFAAIFPALTAARVDPVALLRID